MAFVRKPVRTTKFFRHATAPPFRLPLNLGPGNHKVLVGLAIGCILGDFLVASPLIEVWERFRKITLIENHTVTAGKFSKGPVSSLFFEEKSGSQLCRGPCELSLWRDSH